VMGGYRGIYHDGWYAATTPPITPWSPVLGVRLPDVVTGYNWELYDLRKDFTQANDLAAKRPKKLKEMQTIFDREARKYQVYPLDNRAFVRFNTPRPSATAGRDEFVYRNEVAGIPAANAPQILGRSFTITADIETPANVEGMLATQGGEMGGYAFYILGGRPIFSYNLLAMKRTKWVGPVLTPGQHQLIFEFSYEGPGNGKSGKGVLSVDGRQVDSRDIDRTIPFLMPFDETFDVGIDTRTAVNEDYKVPFAFNGKIDRLSFKMKPH
jgi:hypothetical protein